MKSLEFTCGLDRFENVGDDGDLSYQVRIKDVDAEETGTDEITGTQSGNVSEAFNSAFQAYLLELLLRDKLSD